MSGVIGGAGEGIGVGPVPDDLGILSPPVTEG